MARKKREIDKVEVEEILKMQLREINGVVKKLSYNGTATLNKKIANNPEFIRENGELFNLYPYDFWGGSYKGEDNYGKKRIDEIKSQRDVDFTEQVFEQGVHDVVLAINDLHSSPTKLSKVIINIVEKDRKKIERLEKEKEELMANMVAQKQKIEMMEQAIYNIFYNSKSGKNSIQNMLSLTKSDDWFMKSQIENAFVGQENLIEELKNGNSVNNNVIDIKTSKKLKKLEALGLRKD